MKLSHRLIASAAATAALATGAAAMAAPPPSAKALLSKAYGQARHQKKNVLVMFHASW